MSSLCGWTYWSVKRDVIHLSWLQPCLLYFCVLLQTITLIPPFLRLSHFSTFKGFLTLATSHCNHTILANKHYSFFQHQGGVVHSKPQSGIFHKSLKFGKQPFHIAEAQFWSHYKGSATAASPLLLVFLLALHQLLLLLLFLLSVSTHNHCVQLWELSSCVATYFVHTLALWPFYDIWNKFQHKIYNNPIASISFLQTGCSCLHFVLIHHLLQELNFRLLSLNLYLEVNITCVFCSSSTYNNCNKIFFNFLFAMLYLFCTSLIGSKKMLGSSSFFMTVLFTICLMSSANGGVRLWVVFHHKMCQSFWPPHASFCDNAMESLLATTFSFLLLESGFLVVCILQTFWILKNSLS